MKSRVFARFHIDHESFSESSSSPEHGEMIDLQAHSLRPQLKFKPLPRRELIEANALLVRVDGLLRSLTCEQLSRDGMPFVSRHRWCEKADRRQETTLHGRRLLLTRPPTPCLRPVRRGQSRLLYLIARQPRARASSALARSRPRQRALGGCLLLFRATDDSVRHKGAHVPTRPSPPLKMPGSKRENRPQSRQPLVAQDQRERSMQSSNEPTTRQAASRSSSRSRRADKQPHDKPSRPECSPAVEVGLDEVTRRSWRR
eukprot:523263-Hanusia_phi.AAC.3